MPLPPLAPPYKGGEHQNAPPYVLPMPMPARPPLEEIQVARFPHTRLYDIGLTISLKHLREEFSFISHVQQYRETSRFGQGKDGSSLGYADWPVRFS